LFRLSKIRKALKYSESEIRKAAETVRVTNEIKNRFLSNMSYNIRTPLNNVVGFSQLIASEPNIDEKTREEYSAIIHQSSERLMRLVNDVLDLSRLEAKMMKFQIQDYDAVSLCNEVCYMARMNNEKTGIQVRFTPEVESLSLRTDTTRLGYALLSTLTYPHEHETEGQQEERIIRFTLSRKGEMLYFRILNSPLADEAFTSQETGIRHEINQLLLAYFGGSYQVNARGTEGPEIVFTYPIASESE
ncbi:sensor histidine kinase, partial [Bacteroides thetaiotaomicron]